MVDGRAAKDFPEFDAAGKAQLVVNFVDPFGQFPIRWQGLLEKFLQMAIHHEFGCPFAATEGFQGKFKLMTVPFAKFQVGFPASKPQGFGFAGLPDPYVRPARFRWFFAVNPLVVAEEKIFQVTPVAQAGHISNETEPQLGRIGRHGRRIHPGRDERPVGLKIDGAVPTLARQEQFQSVGTPEFPFLRVELQASAHALQLKLGRFRILSSRFRRS